MGRNLKGRKREGGVCVGLGVVHCLWGGGGVGVGGGWGVGGFFAGGGGCCTICGMIIFGRGPTPEVAKKSRAAVKPIFAPCAAPRNHAFARRRWFPSIGLGGIRSLLPRTESRDGTGPGHCSPSFRESHKEITYPLPLPIWLAADGNCKEA